MKKLFFLSLMFLLFIPLVFSIYSNDVRLKHWYKFDNNGSLMNDSINNKINLSAVGSGTINYTQQCITSNCKAGDYSIRKDINTGFKSNKTLADESYICQNQEKYCFVQWMKLDSLSGDSCWFVDQTTANDLSEWYFNLDRSIWTNFKIDGVDNYKNTNTAGFNTGYYMLTLCWDGNNATVYINTTRSGSNSQSAIHEEDNAGYFLLNIHNDYARGLIGTVDDFAVFCDSASGQVLSDSEISDLYNNWIEEPSPESSTNITLILNNKTRQVYTTLSENQRFFINANVTYNNDGNTVFTENSCYAQANNISAHFSSDNASYELLDDANKYETLYIDEKTTNIIHDRIILKVCREQIAAPVEIYINSTLHRQIPQNVIPLCANGNHTEINVTSAYNSYRALNLTVKCASCDATHKIRLQPEDGEVLQYERSFSLHNESLTYNATTKLHEYRAYPYNYKRAFLADINITCNITSQNTQVAVGDLVPIINIISIDNTPFVSGMSVESNASTFILIDVAGDVVQEIVFNVTYPNGSLVRTTGLEYMNLTASELSKDGLYTIRIFARDNEGNFSSANGTFLINDTTKPLISWIYPSADNTTLIEFGTVTKTLLSLSDINLFAYELLIYYPDSTMAYNFTQIGITSPFTVNKSVNFNVSGKWLFDITVTDSHTMESISDYIFDKSMTGKNITYDFYTSQGIEKVGIAYTGIQDITAIDTVKEGDRYIFNFTLKDIPIGKESIQRFRLTCKGLYYLPQSAYKAHFVCYDSRQWVDFENPDVISWQAAPCGENCYDIALTMKPSKDLVFRSIGGLNTARSAATADVMPETPYDIDLLGSNWFNDTVFDFTSTAGVIALIFLLLLGICLIAVGEYGKVPIMIILSGLYWFFFGWLIFAALTAVLGSIIIVFAVLYMIRGVASAV